MAKQSISALLSQWSPARLQTLFAESPQHAAAGARVLALEGIPQAQLCYGRMLLEGTGMPQSKEEAYIWFTRAAEQADLDALNMVGRCLENGWGTAPDLVQAASFYARAAQAGHAWAQYILGHLYLDGHGVKRDLRRAYRCYLISAEQQNARAMNLVGRCCEKDGVRRAVLLPRQTGTDGRPREATSVANTTGQASCFGANVTRRPLSGLKKLLAAVPRRYAMPSLE